MIRLTPEQLETRWNAGRAASDGAAASANGGRPPQTRTSAGRGSLVRQAIVRLLWFPATAQKVSDEERQGLDASEEAGIELLRELLDNLRASPVQVAAQVIERWADKPDGEHLSKLLQREELVADASAAASELKAALVKLAVMADTQRFEVLKLKINALMDLSAEEMKEFQRLTTRKSPPRSS